MKRLCIAMIRRYQLISRALIAQQFPLVSFSGCRSWPTCSDYSIEVISRYGIIRGGAKSIIRILRCNPFTTPQ